MSDSPLAGAPAVARREPTPPVNYDQTPDQRLADRAAARDQSDPWTDTTRALVRGPNGELQQRPIVRGPDGEATIAPDSGQARTGDAQAQPSGETGERIKVGDVELTREEFQNLMRHKAEQDSLKATLPAAAGGYKLELPSDFAAPGGLQDLKLDTDNPAYQPAFESFKAWAHRNQLSQEAFSEALSIYVSSQANEKQMLGDAFAAEKEKLGPNAPARIDAVYGWLRSCFGDADAKPFMQTLVRESQVRIWERIMSDYIRQGASGFRSNGRQADQESRVSDADWDNMSYTQKKDYAESWSSGGRR
jgi:hypothetical protein